MRPAPLLIDGPARPSFWGVVVLTGVGLVVTVVLLAQEPWPAPVAMMLFAGAAAPLGAIDLRERRLPDAITYPLAVLCAAALVLAASWSGEWIRLGIAVLGCFGATAFFYVMHRISPAQMGLGDVKLMLSLGLVLGWHGVVALLVAVLLGLLLGLGYGVVRIVMGRGTRKSHLALGPHLIVGALVVGVLLY